MSNAHVKIVHYTSKTNKDGTNPVLLRISFQRKLKYKSLGYNCMKNEWDKNKNRFKSKYPNYKAKNEVLKIKLRQAEEVIEDLSTKSESFTFEKFFNQFLNKSNIGLFDFFKTRIQEFEKSGNYGNREVYKNTYSALSKFANNDNLQFSDISYDFLHKWEIDLRVNGCTDGGVSNHMRTFRALINLAIKREIARPDHYPFSSMYNKKGYSLAHLNKKKPSTALSIKDMTKIKNFDMEAYPDLANTVRYFLFSYYARGINFSDMADLKWTQFYDNRFQYRRNKVGKLLSIPVSEPIEEILSYFRVEREENESQYVFPILSDFHKTDTQKRDRRKKCLKNYNKKLKKVAEILEIQANLTSNVARHTYATTLLRKGISIAQISQGLAHADKKTTETYLAQFDTAVIDATDELL
ncbi:MAG: site-specific integrase [Chitinophagales bacterium]